MVARDGRDASRSSRSRASVLRDNPLGDPHVRPLWVYVPPAYDAEPDRRFPSIYLIQGMTGQLDMWQNRTRVPAEHAGAHRPALRRGGLPAGARRLRRRWTSYGGSQFIDSPGTGRYGEYLCDEVVSFVDSRYRTLAEPGHRGLTGKSSGGYGAMVVPMLRPDVFGGLATHSGDALFELCYLPEFREAARALRDDYDGSYERFWEDFRSRPAFTKKCDHYLLNTYAMAACYSANEDGTIDLPFDTATGMLPRRRLAALARVGPGADGAPPRRRAARPCARSTSTPASATSTSSTSAPRRSAASSRSSASPTSSSSCSTRSHGGIEYRYPLAIRYLAERLQ